MSAYLRQNIAEFVAAEASSIVGALEREYAGDGFATQFTAQTRSWDHSIPLFQRELRALLANRPSASCWTLLLEYPLYRLGKRLDGVLLSCSSVIVIEFKDGKRSFDQGDIAQVEEYALDVRDFHEVSRDRIVFPLLWVPGAQAAVPSWPEYGELVRSVVRVGHAGLAEVLSRLNDETCSPIDPVVWDNSPYRPVPSVIEAATAIFAGHSVAEIARADADNVADAGARVLELLEGARSRSERAVIVVTGVPGSGKTLAGLQVVHSAVALGIEKRGDIVYLSGNTPLVVVLREALALDEKNRRAGVSLKEIRRNVRTRIQHINGFLKEYLRPGAAAAPHEHAVVFDEAQRAWDEAQGEKKFGRSASEPRLVLDILSRHQDWCACVCLVGGGQEINSGERGVRGWGQAVSELALLGQEWVVYAPPDAIQGGPSAGSLQLGEFEGTIELRPEPRLQLRVPMRAYRAPVVAEWVDSVLVGDARRARALSAGLTEYPVTLTRSQGTMKNWLVSQTRGLRRYGLVASSGARRLRAEGLGEILSASDGQDIANWYLQPRGDIRSSYALEVPANEYTCQGLELDFVGLCWGGNLLRDTRRDQWRFRRLNGPRWQNVSDNVRQGYIRNAYRVLLTRAREGICIWVPAGQGDDPTRDPAHLDHTAEFLTDCGAVQLD